MTLFVRGFGGMSTFKLRKKDVGNKLKSLSFTMEKIC